MATLIGDYGASSGFHNMIATSGHHYQSSTHSRDAPSRQYVPSEPRSSSPRYATRDQDRDWDPAEAVDGSGASRFPSPPDSSSPSGSAACPSRSDDNLRTHAQSNHGHGRKQAYMASSSSAHQSAHDGIASSVSTNSSSTSAQTVVPASNTVAAHSIPSPASDADGEWHSRPSDDALTLSPEPPAQQTIHVRDLSHIKSLARAGMLLGSEGDQPLQAMNYEISSMPINDIIEMVAALLTKMTSENDLRHDALSRTAVERNANHVKLAQAQNEGSASEHTMSPLSSSVLAFHGKNVPAITILSYLSRIHKYCPTTYEVFLSLVIYFERMTERVNGIVMKSEEAKKASQQPNPTQADVFMRDDDDSSGGEESDEDLADDESDDEETSRPGKAVTSGKHGAPMDDTDHAHTLASSTPPTYFVVDSFNIHRLIIAGVTCASKFFSDVFYTNSRYAKVGGLPLAELNHLELQFLLLNDFRLAIPVEDLEAYATMLVEFYGREIVARPNADTSTK